MTPSPKALRELADRVEGLPPIIRIGCIPDPTRRRSPDSAWPLRRADGKTWAEASQDKRLSRDTR